MFNKKIKERLAAYKYLQMNILEDGVWGINKKSYKHILPKKNQKENILPFIRNQFWIYYAKHNPRLKLHKDFHHLNSSQALCFNLFFPLFMNNKNDMLQLIKGLDVFKNIFSVNSYKFENHCHEDTSIDFAINLDMGRKIFCEIKYSEDGFGAANGKTDYVKRFNEIYFNPLKGKILPDFLNANEMIEHYQVYRNISFAEVDKTAVIFIIPGKNEKLLYIHQLLDTILSDSYKSMIKVFTLESILEIIKQNYPALYADHYAEFRVKYML